ncbi:MULTISPECIES: hypothetical protein [Bacillus]|uniref:hypothetical protein n=1 Tax=Bacillus TaxID=1386 RepID=UPI001F588520|nr:MULTISPECIES: hypothetical protein [Bacillus cereus group]MDA1536437.1 hypothetical protein [Bacillus cereus group sp. TH254-2LC]MDA1547828.1 hypothetical protein [Bacillus cereus group sp. TH253LC]MDA1580957.1 hypothetical protein [Bacillus cereus group sp. TH228LC]MDA1629923.1 hypothetical protein [Bacillus cereus group sp. TH172LC]MDA1833845.1 hypothetical protein [Bacillus cereus group sp. BY142LC]
MKFTKILGIVAALGLSATCYTTDTLAATAVLDNDALSNAPGRTQSSGTWTYRSGSGYNSDYRIANAGASGFQNSNYIWAFNVKNVNATYSVYLANASFNNKRTAYQTGENGGFAYVDQNSAPSGWSNIRIAHSYNQLIAINGALTTKSGNVGADATRLIY